MTKNFFIPWTDNYIVAYCFPRKNGSLKQRGPGKPDPLSQQRRTL